MHFNLQYTLNLIGTFTEKIWKFKCSAPRHIIEDILFLENMENAYRESLHFAYLDRSFISGFVRNFEKPGSQDRGQDSSQESSLTRIFYSACVRAFCSSSLSIVSENSDFNYGEVKKKNG